MATVYTIVSGGAVVTAYACSQEAFPPPGYVEMQDDDPRWIAWLAALANPVPPSVSRAQFFHAAAIDGIITVMGPTVFARAKAQWFQLTGTLNSVPTGVNTVLSGWSSSVSAVAGTMSAAAGTFTAAAADAGVWIFTASNNTAGSSNVESMSIIQNGTIAAWASVQSTGGLAGGLDLQVARVLRVANGDVISSAYKQDSGSTQTMNTIPGGPGHFAGVRVSL